MRPIEKRLVDPERRRSIPAGGFSWLDRRLVREGFLERMDREERLLYLFLVLVADRDGLSYYGDRTIGRHTGLAEREIDDARAGLVRLRLLAFRHPLYQVLALPDAPPAGNARHRTDPTPDLPSPPPRRGDGPVSLADIFARLR